MRLTTLEAMYSTDDMADPGDISTDALLKRIRGHINVMGEALPRNITREREDVNDPAGSSILLLPDKAHVTEYMNCFFDHLNAIYRYLPRGKIQRILNLVYQNDDELLRDDASMALFLSVAGSG